MMPMKHDNNDAKKKRVGCVEKFKKLPMKKRTGILIALFLIVVTILVIPTLAWFSYQKKMGDMQYVDSPTKLYITAAHGEEIKYLDLSDISVTKTSATSKYYVFAVSGSNASSYNLQLAYTTNNQFEYFIYPATEHTGTPGEGAEEPHPIHVTHTDEGETGTSYYYTIDKDIVENPSGSATEDYRIKNGTQITRQSQTLKITTEYLNKQDPLPANAVIDANATKHNDTYAYNYVQDCAEPIYWQAHNIKSDMDPTTRELLDYYILEVSWAGAKAKVAEGEFLDNGETDIIYISVASEN